jgi:hypothetical protein
MRRLVPAFLGLMALSACGGGGSSSVAVSPSVSPSASLGSPSPSASLDASPSADVTDEPPATPSATRAAGVRVDGLVRTTVEGLSVRVEPSVASDRLGVLPSHELGYVVSGPVQQDGYTWYQIAAVRQPYRGDCGDPAPAPSLECSGWFGWAAAGSTDGDPWLAPTEPSCPPERDTAAYLSIDSATRLACAGDDEWTLVVYLAPESEGRGCYPVWITSPGWLDGSCNLFFPQPEETQFDSDERLQAFIHPDLGACTMNGCPFDSLKGSWVEMSGHLDDPAARTCTSGLSSNFAEPPYDPPDPDHVVFACRTRLVVTSLSQTSRP